MNWYEYIEEAQYDYDWSNDIIDIARQAYTAGLQTAYDQMYANEDGDYDFVMYQLKKMIERSK
jgi:sialic acid synthase SpsE